MLYVLIKDGLNINQDIQRYLTELSIEFNAEISRNILADSLKIAKKVSENPRIDRAIIIDEDGIGPFMVVTKKPHIICAMLNDEQSALMTRDHNNANIITLGSHIIGIEVIKGIIERFVTHDYAGGRHQVRIDMLDSMIEVDGND